MSSESIPVGLRSLLAKHYFLAQITRGYKPCMSSMTLIDSSSWLGAVYRGWKGETRKTAISDIENIISQTIDEIHTHRNKPAFLRLIINALASTRVGLESMLTTYRDDPSMIGDVKVQLANIDLRLEEHRDLIKGYTNEKKYTNNEKKIIDEMVNSSDMNDKDGMRNFLIGNQSLPHHNRSSSSNSNNNSESSDLSEQRDRDRRRRRHRVKHSTDGSENAE